jgi:hypothetical protein
MLNLRSHKIGGLTIIEKIEVSMINQNVHNFKKGEFGVENIEINQSKGFIEVKYISHEVGERYVLIPLHNVEKIDFLQKGNPSSSTTTNADDKE